MTPALDQTTTQAKRLAGIGGGMSMPFAEPGEYERGLRDRARDLRRKFFERPDNDNAPEDRTIRVKTSTKARFAEIRLVQVTLPKPKPKRKVGRPRKYITPDQQRQIDLLKAEIVEKHGLEPWKYVGGKGDSKVVRARHEFVWRLRHEIKLSNMNCQDVSGVSEKNIRSTCRKFEERNPGLVPS